MKKYELVNPTTKIIDGLSYDLFQIKALKNFTISWYNTDILAGDLGGFVQSENNLSQEGSCWLFNDSVVINNAKVLNESVVKNSTIYNDATIKGSSNINTSVIYLCSEVNNSAIYDSTIYDNSTVEDSFVKKSSVYENSFICKCKIDFSAISGCVCLNNIKLNDMKMFGNYDLDAKMFNGSPTLSNHTLGDIEFAKVFIKNSNPNPTKYHLVNGTIFHNSNGANPVFQIQALKDFDNIKAGDLGGFISGYHNLSQFGNCWVAVNSYVLDNAKVLGNSKIVNSIIMEKANVDGYDTIIEGSTISGCALVGSSNFNSMGVHIECSQISGKSDISGYVKIIDCNIGNKSLIITRNPLNLANSKINIIESCIMSDLSNIILGEKDSEIKYCKFYNRSFINGSTVLLNSMTYLFNDIVTVNPTTIIVYNMEASDEELKIKEFVIPKNTTYLEYLNLIINKLISLGINISIIGSNYNFTYQQNSYSLTNSTYEDNLGSLSILQTIF
jgi:hypothetical protein